MRKPGAFAHYRYREDLFPTHRFHVTYDALRSSGRLRADKDYLRLLHLAARENVLAFGNPGSGKSHLLCAIGHGLIRCGRPVYVTPCQILVQELLAAKSALFLPPKLKRLGRYDAIIIDDIRYVHQNRDEMEVLFTLLAPRYKRGSVMFTSNLPFSKWKTIFKDPMTTAAAIDRVVHHSMILELNLPSYGLEQSKKGALRPDDEADHDET